MPKSKLIQYVLSALIGVLFIISALAKAKAILNFEYFVYGILHFNIDVVNLSVRLLILLELSIGILFITNEFVKLNTLVSSVFIVSLSIFLALSKNVENCHCFGDMMKMNSTESIFKNVLLLLAIFLNYWLYQKYKWQPVKLKKIISLLALVVTFTVFMIVEAPNYVLNLVYPSKLDGFKLNNSSLVEKVLTNNGMDERKNKIIACVSPHCKYCLLEIKEINEIVKRYQIQNEFEYLVISDSIEFESFNDTLNPYHIHSRVLTLENADLLTEGRLPTIIIHKSNNYYRMTGVDFNENTVKQYLKKD